MSNWVTERANCTLKGIFEELAELVQGDIEEMNELIGRGELEGSTLARLARNPFSIRLDRRDLVMHLQVKVSGRGDIQICSIFLNDDHIAIEPGYGEEIRKRRRFTIQPSWDRGNAQCLLSIQPSDEEESISRNQLGLLVQQFLEPLFFPRDLL